MVRLLRALAAVLALPVMVAGVVPAWLLKALPAAAPLPWPWLWRGLGLALLAAGLALAGWTVSLFFTIGGGTLAPWDPPRTLVLRGPYRHVRNPMISGVVAVLLGEALFWRSPAVLGWALLFWLINAIYIPLSEEPGLARRFGADYAAYCRQVPRWLPRRTPWSPPEAGPPI